VSRQYRQSGVYQLNQGYTQRTLAVVTEGIASGEFHASVPLRIVRDLIFGCAEHHAWAYLRGEGQFSPDEAADAITNLVYQGVARKGVRKVTVDASVHRRTGRAATRGLSEPRRRPRNGRRTYVWRVLIANRGEIARRMRTLKARGIAASRSITTSTGAHVQLADDALLLTSDTNRAYLIRRRSWVRTAHGSMRFIRAMAFFGECDFPARASARPVSLSSGRMPIRFA
jgi:hypothetical protein